MGKQRLFTVAFIGQTEKGIKPQKTVVRAKDAAEAEKLAHKAIKSMLTFVYAEAI